MSLQTQVLGPVAQPWPQAGSQFWHGLSCLCLTEQPPDCSRCPRNGQMQGWTLEIGHRGQEHRALNLALSSSFIASCVSDLLSLSCLTCEMETKETRGLSQRTQ